MPKSGLHKLCEAAVAVWEDFEDELFEKLVESMHTRLEAVNKVNG